VGNCPSNGSSVASKKDGKTEKATPQAKKKAREEGTVARSQEVGMAISLLAAAGAMRVFLPHGADVVRDETRQLFYLAHVTELPTAQLSGSASRMIVAILLPLLAVSVVAAIVAGVAQVGLKPTPKAAKPKLSHLSPKKGLQKFKPSTATWELFRSVLKLGLLVLLVWSPMREWMHEVTRDRGLDAGLARTMDQAWVLLIRVVLLAIATAAADYAWNRRKTARDIRMSKYDIKQEHKNTEGDPLLKGQRRRRQMEMSRNRMIGDVATADVVVTNPTHFAVALRYDSAEGAPRVVAKGTNKLAAKIRAAAYRNGVPVTENKPLARALYRQVKVGHFVPSALYDAVAVVLAFAYRRRGLLTGAAA
jgi:flagellar biosynthesis protein FlhB